MSVVYNNIEVERVKLQLTKPELSKKLSITPRSYNNKIKGISPFVVPELEALSDLTGKSIDFLLGRSDVLKNTG